MKIETVLKKMESEHGKPVQYFLNLEQNFLIVNQLIGHPLKITHTGYQCKVCGSDEPVFRMGFCKKCYFEHPAAGEWIIHPEKSQAHLDIADRDLDFEREMQLQPHYVYLAKTSNVKVGVTRKSQMPTRWIDQGAEEALPFLEVPNRYLAGLAEVTLKKQISDKTSWREMLSPVSPSIDLKKTLMELLPVLPEELKQYLIEEPPLYRFEYPVENYPSRLHQIKFNMNSYENVLTGIRGQYLIFEDGGVLNIRNHEGYVTEWEIT